jgi:3-methylcrotonyl-CoA carboxylase alpha subunit
MEARLYAEDVPAGFLPVTGRLPHLAFPTAARADTGVRSGDEISPYYDPMLAKLIVHGPTRAVALARLSRALADCEVAGTVTNLAFLGALAAHPGFAAGNFDTGLIARDIDALTRPPEPEAVHWVAAGMAALDLATPPDDAGFVLWTPLRHRVILRFGGDSRDLAVEVLGPRAQRWSLPEGTFEVTRGIDDAWRMQARALPKVHREDRRLTVFDRYGLTFEHVDPLERATGEEARGNAVTAPMPGLVRLLAAAPGQSVRQGERLAVLEAMKMEHSLLAARDGTVAEVLVAEGTQVAAGAVLILLEEEPGA